MDAKWTPHSAIPLHHVSNFQIHTHVKLSSRNVGMQHLERVKDEYEWQLRLNSH